MSENIPTNVNNTCTNVLICKKPTKKIKYDKSKLPTPPPDPTTINDNKEKDVFEYLETLIPNYSRSTSTFAPAVATDEAFDHLEKLYKLMEQMLELREQNAKLHRRIRDLEYLNNLEKMQKQLELSGVGKECPDLEQDTAFAETILESILADSSKKDCSQKISTPTRLRPSILRKQRNRSNSTTEKQVTLDPTTSHEDGYNIHDKSAKVSKWTKVKAAFRWEKASNAVGDNKSQDSGIHLPVNVEIARYLRVPSTSDDAGHSPADSGTAGISTPGSLSTTSSTEDFHRCEVRTPYEEFRSSEDEHSQHNYIPHSKDEQTSVKTLQVYKTPWAKMKGIIPSRSSFKKKHRLSAASDDIQIDVELCSDEEVFEDEFNNKSNQTPPCHIEEIKSNKIAEEIVERYQKAVIENFGKNTSKWIMVKKAFLINEDQAKSCPSSPKEYLYEDAIQSDYKKLQKKLSLEFQGKLSEWERLKQSSPGASSPSSGSGFVEENKESNFVKKMEEWQKIKNQPFNIKNQMPSEFDLPADFKKKLQEWEKIKKSSGREASGVKKKLGEVGRWKSLSAHRSETSTNFEYPGLSEDFRKKLEEWKHIKASSSGTPNLICGQGKQEENTPSPNLYRKNSNSKHNKKQKDPDKELQWVEKELGKIEKEKQRLEKERQKFLEREERLSKLRKSVIGGNKKEVLVHTPSGFYRFEGISRKFTQKLYEWEKAKGIAPEASTFALLSSSFTSENKPIMKRHSTSNTPPLTRSLSADSIAMSALNFTCPLISHQPSSLSLNDVEELEKGCLADSKSSSIQYLLESEEGLDTDEPEAVLVEVEDYEEETAGPLQTFFERHQLPIYQREEMKALCEGETIAAPKIRQSESTMAETNFIIIIEDIINILNKIAENITEVENTTQYDLKYEENCHVVQEQEVIYAEGRHISTTLVTKLRYLQEINTLLISSISKTDIDPPLNLPATLKVIQDLSTKNIEKAENIYKKLSERLNADYGNREVLEYIDNIRTNIFEIKKQLNYIYAATDLTAQRKLNTKSKKEVHKTISNESRSSLYDTSDNSRKESQKDEKRYIKSENINSSNSHSQGAVKKRIKYRQKVIRSRSLPDSDDDDENENKDYKKMNRQHKRLTRTKTVTEDNPQEPTALLEAKTIVPTDINYVNVIPKETKFISESPLTVFVKTTRKLFTPIGETNLISNDKHSPNNDTSNLFIQTTVSSTNNFKIEENQESQSKLEMNKNINEMPNEPAISPSPVLQKRVTKEISPSIKLMLAKYNKIITDQDCSGPKSTNSSGSNSPVAWRSPILEKRVKTQTERYQDELIKMSPLLDERKEVIQPASASYLNLKSKQLTVPVKKVSTEENSFTNSVSVPCEGEVAVNQPKKMLRLDISSTNYDTSRKHSPETRLKKLQRAKEEFLRSTPTTAPAQLTNEEVIKFPGRNRLSQISVDSESSYDSTLSGVLIKSASVGMINIDPNTYKQIDPELHGGGYVSLPRNASNPKEKKFGFSSIASKFRKVKMRKGKDKNKESMDAVSTLCKHSLVVDITKSHNENVDTIKDENDLPSISSTYCTNQCSERRSSCDASTTKSNTSWLKKSFFKK